MPRSGRRRERGSMKGICPGRRGPAVSAHWVMGRWIFKQVFTRMTAVGYNSSAVIEWECTYKDSVQGATEGADFVTRHLIDVPTRAFDDFAAGGSDIAANRR